MNLAYNILKKKKKKGMSRKEDPKKEAILKSLMQLFEEFNCKVRRENLQQGMGWRAISGSCRVKEENFVFLDRRLEQEEQIIFLLDRMKEKKIPITDEIFKALPEKIKKII